MDPIGAAWGAVQAFFAFFQNLAPGGFGLILIPLGVLAIVTLLVARVRS